jgi:hypothetical protein
VKQQVKKAPHLQALLKLALALAMVLGTTSAFAESWKFGVMSDTQWIGNDDGKNPNSVAVGIVNQINQQFIKSGVKFVVQVGDLTSNGSNVALDIRATFAQALYNAGIGFFPLRGNHDASQAAAIEFQRIFPQTRSGSNNSTPSDALVTTAYYGTPPANTGVPFTIGASFSSPATATTTTGLIGLSYSFLYNNARFVMLDQFTRTDGTGSGSASVNNNNVAEQQDWINRMLAEKPAGGHAFVFGHKNLIGENHSDNLLGSNPAQNAPARNTFIGSLYNNGVRYYISGHDHIHQRSIITSPDGTSSVMEIIGASDSSKFYTPAVPSHDSSSNNPTRETPITQELNHIGYYIFTIDGPRVTVDYYSAEVNPTLESGEYTISSTPTLKFSKRETFGYSLNGKEFLVPEGESYTVVQQSFESTTARILAGVNRSTAKDGSGRALTKAVDTGWTSAIGTDALASNIVTLWGMASSLGSGETDVYTLSMTYDDKRVRSLRLGNGSFGLATRDADGKWVNAVDKNHGGSKKFVAGPWNPSYGLGAYGVDPGTHTAWAVINYDGDFAINGSREKNNTRAELFLFLCRIPVGASEIAHLDFSRHLLAVDLALEDEREIALRSANRHYPLHDAVFDGPFTRHSHALRA